MTDSDSQCLDFPWMLAKNTSALKHVSQLRRPKQKPSALKQQVPDISGNMTARFADLQHTKNDCLFWRTTSRPATCVNWSSRRRSGTRCVTSGGRSRPRSRTSTWSSWTSCPTTTSCSTPSSSSTRTSGTSEFSFSGTFVIEIDTSKNENKQILGNAFFLFYVILACH